MMYINLCILNFMINIPQNLTACIYTTLILDATQKRYNLCDFRVLYVAVSHLTLVLKF